MVVSTPPGPDEAGRVSRVEQVLARETPGTSNVDPMAMVAALEDVTVRRGTSTLLDSVNLGIGEDERWVLLGPNGAGKTTLLSVLSANMFPTSGTVRLLDEVLGRVDVFELRPRIGLTSSSLAERIPAGERVLDVVISAAWAVIGRWREEYDSGDEGRARGLLYSLYVDHLADRTFGTLSEGERKRVQIARALMTDPELLLLDEPASGLDLAGREALVTTLTELFQDPGSPASVLVTHHVEEIPDGVTHCLLLSGGRVTAAGSLEETLTDANLSAAFGMDLVVSRTDDGRWSARSRPTSRG